MHRIFAIALALVLVAPTLARAQEDFGGLKLKVSQQARVTENGMVLTGEVVSMTSHELVVGDQHLQPGPGLKIERDRGHTGWKGFGIGAAIGAVGGITAVSGAVWGGLIGAGIDQYVSVYDSRAFTLFVPQLSLPLFPAPGRDDFKDIPVQPGDDIVVTQDHVSISGTVSVKDASRLVVGSREFEPGATLRIEKDGDPILDGAAIGFLLGAIAPHLVEEGCANKSGMRCSMESGLTFAIVGALIDLAHRGRTAVYADGHRRNRFLRLLH